ncbi:hypothetical protein GCM10028806_33780 [Spirosoma terrae]|uniref:Uncharacterized protein n=1 Tax=Spirosoma terrae TaxID=1968276 RepID=A0A6L9L5M4_9BACT|nr:hypothetical protein [Spirosoma terrae]NDU95690.1 hypothetical protein [Spirosoma terrae]
MNSAFYLDCKDPDGTSHLFALIPIFDNTEVYDVYVGLKDPSISIFSFTWPFGENQYVWITKRVTKLIGEVGKPGVAEAVFGSLDKPDLRSVWIQGETNQLAGYSLPLSPKHALDMTIRQLGLLGENDTPSRIVVLQLE